jgi:hypothetical protein
MAHACHPSDLGDQDCGSRSARAKSPQDPSQPIVGHGVAHLSCQLWQEEQNRLVRAKAKLYLKNN